ncbi:exo-rhamnogalacturonan lyase family protein [Daejeonella oryzae]|uniref:exo-rhamnogalacturonan lyase family protein n=1 Tax=Daejeonella oryzae TaxID=1122943 RepID=UPI0003FE79B5|nr:hypothetical protein [Daejeonella oryzae]
MKSYFLIIAVNVGLVILFSGYTTAIYAVESVPLLVKQNIAGSPQLLGIPFPVNKLKNSDQLRVLNSKGQEIPSQITIVNTWAPLSESVMWIWVFFFSDDKDQYTLEFGKDVQRKNFAGTRVTVENNTRPGGRVRVNTGPLQFSISRSGGSFLDFVELDMDGDGFDKNDLIAESDKGRGSFLDIIDQAGIDLSTAQIVNTTVEKGSGPLHAIIKVEGIYKYSRKDNNPSPFVIRIHAYAGKSYVRVLHSMVYTGEPDQHTKPKGEYGSIATQNSEIIDEKTLKDDPGWTKPNDQIAKAGLMLKYHLKGEKTFKSGYFNGIWSDPEKEQIFQTILNPSANVSVLQTAENISRIPPFSNSTDEKQITGFKGTISITGENAIEKERMSGWIQTSDKKWSIGVGIRNFFEEYPKELAIHGDSSRIFSYIWSPNVSPMSFARANGSVDSEMIGNFAQGLAKTTEIIYQFNKAGIEDEVFINNFKYFMVPPVSHAPPQWYADSKVYGSFAPKDAYHGKLERGLDYKFAWMQFNQKWEPWYGMLDYGDYQTYYRNREWSTWTNNEPGNDFMWWLEFMRTGNREYFLSGWAASQHTMDVDNIHWPGFPVYSGNTNSSKDFFDSKDSPPIKATPYLGMGRRHAAQHYTSLLSAHVWVPGWIASYYLAGNHRGLDIAEQTGDFYLRREFGEHDLRGRRLYLSIWNLTEIYDANKKQKYLDELRDRVSILLELQKESEQGGSLIIERYGYSQVYISQGLYKYYQITGDQQVKNALIRHAKWQLDNPSLNHKMESYMASIPSLLIGYEFTRDPNYLTEATERAKNLYTDPLPQLPASFKTQKDFAVALEKVSHMPEDTESSRGEAIWKITNGLRIFGWTHIYNIPYLVFWLNQSEAENKKNNAAGIGRR